jgi:hypothetical protein
MCSPLRPGILIRSGQGSSLVVIAPSIPAGEAVLPDGPRRNALRKGRGSPYGAGR